MAKAIITGGAIRVGKAISIALAKAGYDIILIFNNSMSEAREVAEIIRSEGRECFLHKCDLFRKENIDKLFADITRKHKDVTLLVNSASIFEKHGFMESTEQIFDSHMNINFKAPFFLSQNFAYYISRHEDIKDAAIINILDKESPKLHTGHFVYHLTKNVLGDLTQMLEKDLGPRIRVNSVSLGRVLPPKQKDEKLDLSQYPKLKEATDAILRLSSNNLTGQDIVIESDPELKKL